MEESIKRCQKEAEDCLLVGEARATVSSKAVVLSGIVLPRG